VTHSAHSHCRPPRYKYKRKRLWVETQCEWEMYRARLLSLRAKEPSLTFSPEVKKALSVNIEEYRGVRYKILDDLLDGIFCAYLAYYFWYWGDERRWIVGDMNDGYVGMSRCRDASCLNVRFGPRNPASTCSYVVDPIAKR
jgi:predicted RNase H-like nuclease